MASSESSAEQERLDDNQVICTNNQVTSDQSHGSNKPIVPPELILGALSYSIKADNHVALWSDRFGVVQELEHVRRPPETIGFPDLQNDCAVEYFTKKRFSVIFDVSAGHTFNEILTSLDGNAFLKEHLDGPDDFMRVRRLLLVIRPGPSHITDFDGETGVVFEITYDVGAAERTIKRFHDYKIDTMLAWPYRGAVHRAIVDHLNRINLPDDRSPFIGLKYQDIVGLCRLVDAHLTPPFYNRNEAAIMLRWQSAYRNRRKNRTEPGKDYVTDDEEYSSEQS